LEARARHHIPSHIPQRELAASRAAADSLEKATGMRMPLDSVRAWEIWRRYEKFSDAALLRRHILEDIRLLSAGKLRASKAKKRLDGQAQSQAVLQ